MKYQQLIRMANYVRLSGDQHHSLRSWSIIIIIIIITIARTIAVVSVIPLHPTRRADSSSSINNNIQLAAAQANERHKEFLLGFYLSVISFADLSQSPTTTHDATKAQSMGFLVRRNNIQCDHFDFFPPFLSLAPCDSPETTDVIQ